VCSADSDSLVSASQDGTLIAWSLATRQAAVTLRGHVGAVTACALRPARRPSARPSNILASGGADGTIRLWSMSKGAELHLMKPPGAAAVQCVSFSPDGARLLSGGADRTLRMWSLLSGEQMWTAPSLLASLFSGTSGHCRPVTCAAFTPDGARVLSGSDDATLRVWDSASGAFLGMLGQGGSAHADAVMDCAFSPGGRAALSASWDGSVKLWDVASGALSAALRCGDTYVLSVAVASDGQRVASCGSEGVLRLWGRAEAAGAAGGQAEVPVMD